MCGMCEPETGDKRPLDAPPEVANPAKRSNSGKGDDNDTVHPPPPPLSIQIPDDIAPGVEQRLRLAQSPGVGFKKACRLCVQEEAYGKSAYGKGCRKIVEGAQTYASGLKPVARAQEAVKELQDLEKEIAPLLPSAHLVTGSWERFRFEVGEAFGARTHLFIAQEDEG